MRITRDDSKFGQRLPTGGGDKPRTRNQHPTNSEAGATGFGIAVNPKEKPKKKRKQVLPLGLDLKRVSLACQNPMAQLVQRTKF